MKTFYLLALLLVSPVHSDVLETIFPFANQEDVQNLRIQINRTDSLEDRQTILNNWIDEKWIEPSPNDPVKLIRPKTVRKYPFENLKDWEKPFHEADIIEWNNTFKWTSESLNDKEFARFKAIQYLEHRHVVQIYIDTMVDSSREMGFMTKNEALKMRDNFYLVDKECEGVFNCTKRRFLSSLYYHTVQASVLKLDDAFSKFPPLPGHFDWTLGTVYEESALFETTTQALKLQERREMDKVMHKLHMDNVKING